MSRYFALSLFFHLALAVFVVILANPIRIAVGRDRIAVSVLLNSATENIEGTEARPHAPEVREPKPPVKTVTKIREHYHASPAEKNAVLESSDAHPVEAKPEVGSAPAGGHHGSLDENTEYITAVLDVVSKAKKYPRISQDREEEGLVILAVSIRADGTVVDVRTEQTTPYERLNQAAVETVRGIKKFPTPPAIGAEILTLHIPIRYKLERS